MSAVGWLIAAAGVALLYLSLKPRAAAVSSPSLAERLGGGAGFLGDPHALDPGAPVIVGIPKSILPTGYAECIASGGLWNYNGGSCVTAG